MHTEIKSDDILDIIVGRTNNPSTPYNFAFRTTNRDLAIDALYTYMVDGVKSGSIPAILLLEIVVSAAEGVKAKFPDIAASVRKMNLEQIKKQNDAPNQ